MFRDDQLQHRTFPRKGEIWEVQATEWIKITFDFEDNNISHPFCKQELWWCANYTLLPAPRSQHSAVLYYTFTQFECEKYSRKCFDPLFDFYRGMTCENETIYDQYVYDCNVRYESDVFKNMKVSGKMDWDVYLADVMLCYETLIDSFGSATKVPIDSKFIDL